LLPLCDLTTLQTADRPPLGQEAPGQDGAVGAAGQRTAETVSAADEIIDALDLAADEEERMQEFEQVGRGPASVCRGCGGTWAVVWVGPPCLPVKLSWCSSHGA
jgi:hypothetical protein